MTRSYVCRRSNDPERACGLFGTSPTQLFALVNERQKVIRGMDDGGDRRQPAAVLRVRRLRTEVG